MMTTNKTLYILLTDTGSILTKLIKLYTKQRYNHVSLSFDKKLREVYSFGRKNMKNPFKGGFVRENTKEGLFKEATCAVYSISVTEDQLERIQDYIKGIEKDKDEYRYNFLGLFGFLMKKPIKRNHAFFCSQFVASSLQQGGILDSRIEPALLAPSDIQEHEGLRLIYEGKLKHYLHEDTVDSLITSDQFGPAFI